MKKIVSILLILVGALSLNTYGQADTTTTIQQDKAITLKIEDMSCEFCARGLKSSLEKLDGISIHQIDPKEGFAKLSFKQAHIPSDRTLKETVENAGFKLVKVQRDTKDDSDQDS
ncbi:MAG: heavy-metal-associated domain-containing protein [Gracilimonas sp.]|uniref:heavy-metal-associated domain-containing protein n=1 Tax=Gracilimonas sp. TaxID=1974203 RepID=UPI003752416D|nr:heavy-metal-associated domain-containing protein [Gracilimonas sp.]